MTLLLVILTVITYLGSLLRDKIHLTEEQTNKTMIWFRGTCHGIQHGRRLNFIHI